MTDNPDSNTIALRQDEWRTHAHEWYVEHRKHVDSILRSPAYEPSGSDLFRPELWKGNHWAWFLQRQDDIGFVRKIGLFADENGEVALEAVIRYPPGRNPKLTWDDIWHKVPVTIQKAG